MLTAITRDVSPSINQCELSFQERYEIDVAKAVEQHRAYERCLEEFGAHVISLPAEIDLPDSVFVEDPAIVLGEIAVMTRMGAESRRGESQALATALEPFRPLHWITEPATIEGGDVLRIGRDIFVGLSGRTNAEGVFQLREALAPFGYTVTGVALHDCLHLKSAICGLGNGLVLANREWIDTAPFASFEIIDVDPAEPTAANVLSFGDAVLMPEGFPGTAARIEARGYKVRTVDIGELRKAEAGVTCSCLLFNT